MYWHPLIVGHCIDGHCIDIHSKVTCCTFALIPFVRCSLSENYADALIDSSCLLLVHFMDTWYIVLIFTLKLLVVLTFFVRCSDNWKLCGCSYWFELLVTCSFYWHLFHWMVALCTDAHLMVASCIGTRLMQSLLFWYSWDACDARIFLWQLFVCIDNHLPLTMEHDNV